MCLLFFDSAIKLRDEEAQRRMNKSTDSKDTILEHEGKHRGEVDEMDYSKEVVAGPQKHFWVFFFILVSSKPSGLKVSVAAGFLL